MWRSVHRYASRLQHHLTTSQTVRCTGPRHCSQTTQSGVPYETNLSSVGTTENITAPSSADVVIIGGGSVGCSTLYHLAKLGVTNTVLIEKDQLTAGTTWHTAGLVWGLRPSDTEIELLCYMRHLVGDVLEEETGVVPGWINNGGLFVASNKERLDEYKRMGTVGKAFGVESHILSPEETKKLYPLMNCDDIYGTLYSPGDGTIDPAGFCTALTRSATKAGAKVLTSCHVTGIQTGQDDFGIHRVQAVETSGGTIKTPVVINCTGVWAPNIGAMANVAVPLLAMKHAYIVTERIEGIQNMPNVRDHDASIYLKLQGDALSIGGYENNPEFIEKMSNDFAFSLYDLDWDVFSVHIDGHVHRVPVIGETGIKSTVCGPESFTPDHKPLLGEAPELRGFYHGCAFNSSGLMLGGGCGRELAKWVVNGRPDLDMYGYDIRRFSRSLVYDKAWIKERSHEAYAKNYSTVFPYDQPLAGRNKRKDALHQVLLDAGCVYQEALGWERPGYFTPEGKAELKDYDYYGSYGNEAHKDYAYNNRLLDDYTFEFPKHHDVIGKECLAARNAVAVFNMSYFGQFYLTGPDAQATADWIFTNNLDKPVGSTVYTCMCNKAGGTEGDLTVSVIDSMPVSSPLGSDFDGRGFYVAAGGGVAEHVKSHMQTEIQDKRFNCQIVDVTNEMGVISIQGPKSRELLQALATDVDFSNEAFPFSTHKIMTIAGHQVRAIRLTFVGELGWELHVPNDAAVDVYQAVMREGAKHGIANGGYRALDSLSLEKGYRHWHGDLRSDDTPLESGLGFTCKLKMDTPFLGREALEKQKAEGLKRRIACFTADPSLALLGMEVIRRNGEVVSYFRRADHAFALNRGIGYGYVQKPDGSTVTNAYLKEGEYTVERMGEIFPAQIHLKTPFDPSNNRIKGIYE
ncbi:sarcosine dehydrogenase, mitochondrial-like [Lytechinus variegatus]|uniref:sarcosine dehydrogenase, mitochondrial-like n=1 Tax=Lytechinus variegatus TaxID=7654 RepID=UPI001BB27FDC|nr:sarcosine dehydrogenase, mitochondrial-like [Lytechinus variegatus]XP_041481409.1 sarcosine dehydrogenase, mitochondrial-like [Lytechinus variegatus]XP_041481410.1 sarcosine dehydrogenase, mitochondrial-like [Lytechinus variegatus]